MTGLYARFWLPAVVAMSLFAAIQAVAPSLGVEVIDEAELLIRLKR